MDTMKTRTHTRSALNVKRHAERMERAKHLITKALLIIGAALLVMYLRSRY